MKQSYWNEWDEQQQTPMPNNTDDTLKAKEINGFVLAVKKRGRWTDSRFCITLRPTTFRLKSVLYLFWSINNYGIFQLNYDIMLL